MRFRSRVLLASTLVLGAGFLDGALHGQDGAGAREPGRARARDGGTLYAEVARENGLRLTVDRDARPDSAADSAVLRLSITGGTPGHAGAVVTRPAGWTSAGRAVLPVLFDADGAVTLMLGDALTGGLVAQGCDFATRTSTALVSLEPTEAVELGALGRQVQDLAPGERVRVRWVGPARLGSLQGTVDAEVELARDPRGYTLVLGPELLRASGLAELGAERSAVPLAFARAEDLVATLESVGLLQAFASLEDELRETRAQATAVGIRPGAGAIPIVLEPPAPPTRPVTGPPNQAGPMEAPPSTTSSPRTRPIAGPPSPVKDPMLAPASTPHARPVVGPPQGTGPVEAPPSAPSVPPTRPIAGPPSSVEDPMLAPASTPHARPVVGPPQETGPVEAPPSAPSVPPTRPIAGPPPSVEDPMLAPLSPPQTRPVAGPPEMTDPVRAPVFTPRVRSVDGALADAGTRAGFGSSSSSAPGELERASRTLRALRAELARLLP